ncbi:hypothetical protein FB565_004861 [Actinoplanes lutulentus]|nr:DUF2530 domain-containing protein [Actinoplanes lutulentus]MBB2945128.1 hypothetical protein [Actinoplanes lutulentus]
MSDLSPATKAPDVTKTAKTLDAVVGTKPRPEPLDPPMLPFALAGVAAFAVALLVTWLAGAPDHWVEITFAGLIWGIPGTLTMVVHDRGRKHRRVLTHPEFTVTG